MTAFIVLYSMTKAGGFYVSFFRKQEREVRKKNEADSCNDDSGADCGVDDGSDSLRG